MADQPITNPGAPWFKAPEPLPDGVYLWKDDDETRELVGRVEGGVFKAEGFEKVSYDDGWWCGPIPSPTRDILDRLSKITHYVE